MKNASETTRTIICTLRPVNSDIMHFSYDHVLFLISFSYLISPTRKATEEALYRKHTDPLALVLLKSIKYDAVEETIQKHRTEMIIGCLGDKPAAKTLVAYCPSHLWGICK